MSDDLLTVIPETVMVKVRGEDIVIRQIKVGQLSKILRLSQPFYSDLKATKARLGAQDPDGSDFYALVMNNVDAVLAVVAVLTDKPPEWIAEIGFDELTALFGAIVEVNLDFFIQKVFPSLSRLVTELGVPLRQVLSPTDGQTLSSP